MALIDSHQQGFYPPEANARPGETLPSLPLAALDRLRQIHAEGSQAARLALFLQGAVHAAGALMLLGIAALAFAADTSLPPCFVWSLLVLGGIGALLHSYIRSTAAAVDRAPTAKAVKALRAILLYAGFAWGMGAFLVLSPESGLVTVLLFAGVPSLSLSLLLKDRDGALAFLVPVTALGIAAAIWNVWPDAGLDTALLLILQSGIAAHGILRSRGAVGNIPAGLALR